LPRRPPAYVAVDVSLGISGDVYTPEGLNSLKTLEKPELTLACVELESSKEECLLSRMLCGDTTWEIHSGHTPEIRFLGFDSSVWLLGFSVSEFTGLSVWFLRFVVSRLGFLVARFLDPGDVAVGGRGWPSYVAVGGRRWP
jgi:hypothetical protein